MNNKFLKQHSSTILTCVGAVGVIATAVAAVKATPKAMSLLEKAKKEKNADLTKLEKVKIAAPAYIPSVVIGASTIACIFGANILNKRQQATLTSAYALIDSSYKEYKAKVKEIYGEEGHNKIVNTIAADTYKECDEYLSDGQQTFFDFFSLQLFESSIADIRDAELYINNILQERGYVSLAEFYEKLGIPCGETDYELGWSKSQGTDYIEFFIEKVVSSDKENQYVLSMYEEPTMDFLL